MVNRGGGKGKEGSEEFHRNNGSHSSCGSALSSGMFDGIISPRKYLSCIERGVLTTGASKPFSTRSDVDPCNDEKSRSCSSNTSFSASCSSGPFMYPAPGGNGDGPVLFALLGVVLWALCDEFHQSFVPNADVFNHGRRHRRSRRDSLAKIVKRTMECEGK